MAEKICVIYGSRVAKKDQYKKRWWKTQESVKRSEKEMWLFAWTCPAPCDLGLWPVGFSAVGILQEGKDRSRLPFLFQGIFLIQEWTQVSCIAEQFFIHLNHQEAHERSDIHIIGIWRGRRNELETMLKQDNFQELSKSLNSLKPKIQDV